MTTVQDDTIAKGELILLRRKRIEDARNDFEWRRDEVLARYDAAKPTSLTFDEFLAQYRVELEHPQPFRKTFAVDDLAGTHIGNVMYYNIDLARREAELGITIGDPDYWGRGYGSEATRLLVEYVFKRTTIRRLYLHTLDWNVRAQRAFARVGFQDCGRTRRGEYRFHVMELRRDWICRDD